jgi:PAS domain S-box-containing protein
VPEERYRTILENIEEGYYEVDLKGNFTFFNPAMCRILGYPEEEMLGLNNRQYMDHSYAKTVFQVFFDVFKTGLPQKHTNWGLIRKDGKVLIIEASVSLMKDAGGNPVGFRGICRDVTERKKAEEEIRKAKDELEIRVIERTAELDKAKQELEITNQQLQKAIERANTLTLEAALTNEAKTKFLVKLTREIRSSSDSLMGMIEAFLTKDAAAHRDDR